MCFFNIFTELFNYHYSLNLEHFCHPQRNSANRSNSPFQPHLQPYATTSSCSGHMNGITQYVFFVTGFFNLAQCFQGWPMLYPILVFHSFLLVNNMPFKDISHFIHLFIILWTFEWIFHFRAIMNNATINTDIQDFVWNLFFHFSYKWNCWIIW